MCDGASVSGVRNEKQDLSKVPITSNVNSGYMVMLMFDLLNVVLLIIF